MSKILMFFSLITCFNSFAVFSQEIDTVVILKNIKIHLLPELKNGVLSESGLRNYFNRPLEGKPLKSKGFDNYIFFKITDQILSKDSIKTKNLIVTYKMPFCMKNEGECAFIYAYNKQNQRLYCLKGSEYNRFLSLYNEMSNQIHYWQFPDKIKKKTVKLFTDEYWVEGLDFECLLLSLKGKKGSCLDYYSPPMVVY